MTATTIKVSTELRDRLNAVAEEQGLTAGSMVEKLLEDWLWRQQVELAKQQMRSATKEEWADYLAEAEVWDVVAGDGLEDDPWEG
jgi:predicted transcriptional regulator